MYILFMKRIIDLRQQYSWNHMKYSFVRRSITKIVKLRVVINKSKNNSKNC